MVRVLAFYLPQFHRIPENDSWWEPGFTEWTMVARAQPLFKDHYQPHLPKDGFYDLLDASVRERQAELARAYGISAFCYWHYWFHGKRLLERPFEVMLGSGRPKFPFCLAWANEPWNRRWDGMPGDMLQEQTYSPADDYAHAAFLKRVFEDDRYFRISGRPAFLIYKPQYLPSVIKTVDRIREVVPEVYLIGVDTNDQLADPDARCFDAILQFQPKWDRFKAAKKLLAVSGGFAVEANQLFQHLLTRREMPMRQYFTVFPQWDNSPRYKTAPIIVHGMTPERYLEWLRYEIQHSKASHPSDEELVFVHAWNEWGEGAHLEPDLRHDNAYLEATWMAVREAM